MNDLFYCIDSLSSKSLDHIVFHTGAKLPSLLKIDWYSTFLLDCNYQTLFQFQINNRFVSSSNSFKSARMDRPKLYNCVLPSNRKMWQAIRDCSHLSANKLRVLAHSIDTYIKHLDFVHFCEVLKFCISYFLSLIDVSCTQIWIESYEILALLFFLFWLEFWWKLFVRYALNQISLLLVMSVGGLDVWECLFRHL